MVSLDRIRNIAMKLGVEHVDQMDKTELIRAIQRKEGHSSCFNTDWCRPEWRERCAWKDDCLAKDYFPDSE